MLKDLPDYQDTSANFKTVVPAGIAGTQKPRMATQAPHPCELDTGNPCRYDGLAETAC